MRECGSGGYCEAVGVNCASGFVRCQEYDEECGTFEWCCCPEEEYGRVIIPELDLKLASLIILVIAVSVVVFLFFAKRVKGGMSFEDLYKKWGS